MREPSTSDPDLLGKPTDEMLTAAMEKYTKWLDDQIEQKLQNVDHFVDQMHKMKN